MYVHARIRMHEYIQVYISTYMCVYTRTIYYYKCMFSYTVSRWKSNLSSNENILLKTGICISLKFSWSPDFMTFVLFKRCNEYKLIINLNWNTVDTVHLSSCRRIKFALTRFQSISIPFINCIIFLWFPVNFYSTLYYRNIYIAFNAFLLRFFLFEN